MELIIFISAHCQCGELMHHDPLSSGRCLEKSGCRVLLYYWNVHSLDSFLFGHYDYTQQRLYYGVRASSVQVDTAGLSLASTFLSLLIVLWG